MEERTRDDPTVLILYPTHAYPYTAGILGGLLGGVVMTLPALGYSLLSGHGPWYPINLVAATLLRSMQTLSPQQIEAFDPLALGVGLSMHLVLATLVGLLFALLLPTLPGPPHVWALIIGPLLWMGATAIVLPQINPVMSRLIDWPSFALANLLYGLVMGYWVASTPQVPAETAHHLRLHWPTWLASHIPRA